MAETPLHKAERHIASLERVIEKQERILNVLKAMGDAKEVALASDLMASFRKSLALAREHRDLLARLQRR